MLASQKQKNHLLLSYFQLALNVLIITSCGSNLDNKDQNNELQSSKKMAIYAPNQHQLYDGHFKIQGGHIHQVGRLNELPPWDHMGNDAQNITPVEGVIMLDVNEIENTGSFKAELNLPEGKYVVNLERIHEFSPCQDGGIAAFLYEHGDSGCGDANWPKSLLFVAGWGYGSATLNDEPLYQNYEIHFMVTQGMRDRNTLKVMLKPTDGDTGSVNPATQQLDFYIRSPAHSTENHPNRKVFDHFFAMEVAWH